MIFLSLFLAQGWYNLAKNLKLKRNDCSDSEWRQMELFYRSDDASKLTRWASSKAISRLLKASWLATVFHLT